MLKQLSSILFFLFALPCMAQKAAKIENVIIPAVSVTDLKETSCPADSAATAAYLYRHGKTYFELNGGYWVMVTQVYTRVKVYKKEGYDYANPELVFYSGSNKARGSFSNAVTYNLENGQIVKTPLNKESEFKETLEGEVTHKTIALPNVKEGSIIEYSTTVKTPFFSNLADWYFQYDIPVKDVRYDITIPVYFQYNIYNVGYVDVKMTDPAIIYNSKTENNEFYYSYKATDVTAFKDEAYINNRENYIGKLEHELSKVQLPNRNPESYATDWKSVAKKIYESEYFGRELRLEGYYKDDFNALMAGLETDDAKMNAIFNYVQSHMHWNENTGYLADKGVKEAYKIKEGNVADINLMLTAMLREAGLDANPVLVSTRSHGIALYPSRYAFNYIICAVKLGNNLILLDATSKYTKPGILPTRALNWVGRLIKKNGDTEEIDLMPKANSKEIITAVVDIDSEGVISGKIRDQYMDQRAYVHRELFAEADEDSYLEKLEKQYAGIQVSDYNKSNQNDLDKPFLEDYSFTNDRVADVIGKKIYISPMLFFTEAETPFKEEKREYPIDFIYPREDKYLITLKVPDGYTIESLPQPLNISMQENIGSFKYNIAAKGNSVQLSAILSINYASVSKEYYSTLKDFYKKMIEKQNEKIVLVKQ